MEGRGACKRLLTNLSALRANFRQSLVESSTRWIRISAGRRWRKTLLKIQHGFVSNGRRDNILDIRVEGNMSPDMGKPMSAS